MGGQLIAAIFATYALANMIAKQEGPGGVFFKLRALCGAYDYGPQKGPGGEMVPATRLGRFIKCPYCVSPYMAGLFVPLALYGWERPLIHVPLLILGVTGTCYALLDLSR